MPAVASARATKIKDHWWVVLVFVGLIGAWLTLPFLSGTGSGSVSINDELSANEQSLHSLGEAPSPVGGLAPGSRRRARDLPDGAGSLYQSGGPVADGAGAQAVQQLAAALRDVSKSAPPPAVAAGKRAPAAGGPQAAFAAPGLTASAGSSSGASLALQKPFGTGGDPGLEEGKGSFSGAGGVPVAAGNGLSNSASFASLNQAKANAQTALVSRDEAAVATAKKTFDFAQSRAQSLTGGGDGGGGGPPSMDGNTPASLKGGDPSLGHKDFTPPPVGAASETKDKNNSEYMKQQMIMMLIAVAIGGIAGPVFGAVGNSIVKGMGMNAPTNPATGSGVSGTKIGAGGTPGIGSTG